MDVYFDNGCWASIMGRISNVGGGYGCNPRAYYLRLSSTGAWGCYYINGGSDAGTSLSSGSFGLSGTWHNLKIRFSGTTITGFIQNTQVFSITDSNLTKGMVGLGTGDVGNVRNTAMFGNLIINTVNGSTPPVTVFAQDSNPPYGASTGTTAPTAVPTTAPTVAPGTRGDANGSGAVDIVDGLLIAQYYVGLNPSGFVSANADTDCSGTIDIVDALPISQSYAGLPVLEELYKYNGFEMNKNIGEGDSSPSMFLLYPLRPQFTLRPLR